jgi:hypothetical protein
MGQPGYWINLINTAAVGIVERFRTLAKTKGKILERSTTGTVPPEPISEATQT